MKQLTKFKADRGKFFSLLVILLLSGLNTYAQLSGTYSVGPSGNYTTLTAAVSALNNSGVSGPVTLSLTGSSYSTSETFPIVINQISGASATNTITIKPATGVSPTISGSVTNAALIKINGTDYLTIDGSNTANGTSRDLTITNTGTNSGNGTSTSANAVIWIANSSSTDGATYNTIKNCKITGSSITNTHMVIFSGGNTGIGYGGFDAVTPNSYNVISNNYISKAIFGIWLKGNNASKPLPPDVNNQILNNTLGSSASGEGFDAGAIIVQLGDGATISGNDVANVVGSGGTPDYTNSGSNQIHFGIHVRNSKNVKVIANRVHNIEYNGTGTIYTHGIHADNNVYQSSSSPSTHSIINNLVYDIRVSSTSPSGFTSSGITLNGGNGDKVYYNSVNIAGKISVSSGPTAAFSNGTGYNSTSNANIDVQNNIFAVNGTSGSSSTMPKFYAHYTTATSYSGSTVDYNNYYANSSTSGVTSYLGYFNASNYSTLSDWRSATSQDAKSLFTDPLFVSATDLRTFIVPLNNAAIPISSVTTDFTGKTRSTTTPDIGAYEFTPPANDLRMLAILNPVNGSCSDAATKVKVVITNNGTNSQSNFAINAAITGTVTQNLSHTYTKTLSTGSIDTVTFTSTFNSTGTGTYNIKSYTSLSTDQDKTNDSAAISGITLYAKPSTPTPVNASRCTPGSLMLRASKGTMQILKWYTSATAGIPVYEGDTFTTKNLNITTTFYVEAWFEQCASQRVAVTASINKKPVGSSLSQGSTFQGKYNTGTSFDRDIVCTGGTVQYLLQPPTGFSNSDYGSKWTLSNYSFTTDKGSIPSAGLTIVSPSTTASGTITFVSSSAFEDSLMLANITIRNITTGCDTSFARYLYVAPQPKSDFSFTDVCSGGAVNFQDKSTISKGTFSYSWNFGDGKTSNVKNPQHQYTNLGTYTVKLKIVSFWGCIDSIEKQVTVSPSPAAGFTTRDECLGTAINFTNTSTISSGSIAGYKWDFGNGSTSTQANPSHNYTSAGKYDVKLIVISVLGCKDSIIRSVNVLSKPVAGFTAGNVCMGESVKFSNTTSITPSSTTVNYSWDFGDGKTSTAKDPAYSYAAPGTYTVKLVAEAPGVCTDEITKQITVNPRAVAKISMKGSCQNKAVLFTDSSTVSSGKIASRVWKFGEGTASSTLANPTYTYKQPGVYTIKLKVTTDNGCSDSTTRTLTVTSTPVAGFSATSACEGEAISFTNTSVAPSGRYLWSFGDGDTSSQQDPSHIYTKAGTYKAYLAVLNPGGCVDTVRKDVIVKALPSARFTVVLDSARNVVLTPDEQGHPDYLWNFGDGNTSNKVISAYKYNKDTSYRISLLVTGSNGCSSQKDTTINISTTGLYASQSIASMKVEIAPNPFTTQTQLSYDLDKSARVKVSVYDLSGKEIAVIADQKQSQGKYTYSINAETYKMNAGIYLLRVLVDDNISTKQIIRLK